MTEEQEGILKECLGILQMPQPIHWGYRNWYLPRPDQLREVQSLVQEGYLLTGMTAQSGIQFMHATRKTCHRLGLSEARIDVAMDQGFD
jgi:hypothetical protein